jgi:Polyketide synthase dehydratase
VGDNLKIRIDPLLDTFLLDHVVAGAPLLPTVMQLDLAVRALPACRADREAPAGIMLRDVVIGTPVRFDRPGPRELHLVSRRCGPGRAGPDAVGCELRSPGEPAAHLTAIAERTIGPVPPARTPGAWASRLPCGPSLIYPPFFHGPAFAVVGRFGRSAAGLTASLASGLPPLRWVAAGTVLQPRLLELLLQCCGLWELADSGRMMVPAAIERVHWHPGSLDADPGGPAVARVVPRPGHGGGIRVFDGQVLDSSGSVMVTVAGYRAADLGLSPDLAHAARLRRCLTDLPATLTADAVAEQGAPS